MAGRAFLVLLCLLALAPPATARPQVLVVIADHLTLTDVTGPGLPNLARLWRTGDGALMSPGTAQGHDPVANVYATLGAGDSIHAGGVSEGLLSQTLAAARVRTALIGEADGDDTGEDRPALLVLPAPSRSFLGPTDGTVRDPVAAGGWRIAPALLWARTQTALRDCDLVVVHLGDFARIERENQQGDLLPRSYQAHRRQALAALDQYLGLAAYRSGTVPPRWLMLVVPTGPLNPQGGWDRLTPFLRVSPQTLDRVDQTAFSDTTQTAGLVASRDIAPTILQALGIPPPLQMTGSVIRARSVSDEQGLLRRLDQITRLNQDAQNPLFWGLGFGAAVLIFGSLGLYLSGRMAASALARRVSLYSMCLLAAWPLALLVVPLTLPSTLSSYFAVIVVLSALVALLPSPSLIYALTAVVLIGDGLAGTRLVSQSVLSAYALSGIRFYGIGNEYMGLLLGGALLGAAALPLPLPGRGPLLLLWFGVITFVLSFPAFGAKAGGAITASVTFTLAWRWLTGRRVTWRWGLGALLAGFGLVFLWALVGHWLPLRRTHIETAVGALGQGRLGYIAGVALRKAGLALRLTLLPGTLLGLLGLALIAGFARLYLARQVTEHLARHARFAAVWRAGLWGCLTAVLVNDSGVIAAILLATCLIVTLLHGLYQECALWPSTSVTSESESPSATP